MLHTFLAPSRAQSNHDLHKSHRYELLDEVMDHGYPQITDPAVLKSLITQRGFSGDMPVLAVELLQKVRGCETERQRERQAEREREIECERERESHTLSLPTQHQSGTHSLMPLCSAS